MAMTARLLWSLALIATIMTCSMAIECFHGPPGTDRKLPCETGWCKKELSLSSSSNLTRYDCDTENLCTTLKYGCHDGQDDEKGNFQAKKVSEPDEEGREHHGRYKVCCCDDDLCNSATLHIQHILLGVISFIVPMLVLT